MQTLHRLDAVRTSEKICKKEEKKYQLKKKSLVCPHESTIELKT